MNLIKIAFIQIILLLSFTTIFAQNNVPVLITGNIKNNGAPVGTDIRIVDEKGSSFKVKSNSNDGFYQQSLISGTNYHIFIDGFLITDGNNRINIAPSSDYKEFTFNFDVIKLDNGLEIFKSIGFEKSKAIITKEGIEYLTELKELSKTQKSVIYFDFVIGTGDNDFKPKKEKITEIVKVKGKEKKKTKTITVSVEEQKKRLFSERENVLLEKLAEIKINKRNVTIIHDNTPMPKAKNTKGKTKKKDKEASNQPKFFSNLSVKINKVSKL